MSEWMNFYDGVFFISAGTIIFSFFGLAIRYCLKSKCERFDICFGLFRIDRRVDLEVQEEMIEMELGRKNQPIINDKQPDENKSGNI